jgi:geranylgeranyl diphosphate synthase, type I
MFLGIKNKIDSELSSYIKTIDKLYSLSKISPLLFNSIKEFLSRDGKRVRPILFVIGYRAFSRKNPKGLYSTALSLELLHDFMLVHDDIIDKSPTRRGKPSMHAALNKYLNNHKKLKFSGEDLAIVIGDVIYALALNAFLAVKENMEHKEAALKKLTEAAFYTGSGEFIELICGIKPMDKISQEDIYKIYDFKTATYTFAAPLSIGATLAGAKEKEIKDLFNYGIYLGRAFQIKDDILGIFASQKETGKSNLTDLQEAKKTILIWHAYNHSKPNDKSTIKKILSKDKVNKTDLLKISRIIESCGSLNYARNEINKLIRKAENLIQASKIPSHFKNSLNAYSKKLLG